MCTTILQKGAKLFRYDVEEPPTKWSIDFKNREYHYPNYGAKNLFGGFFFFQSEEQTLAIGEIALGKNPNLQKLWLTECRTTADVCLLDLTQQTTVTANLIAMQKEGIDVLTNDFLMYGLHDSHSFAELHDDIDRLSEIAEHENWMFQPPLVKEKDEIVEHVERFFGDHNYHMGHFGQRLTDFENGLHFKKLLQDRNLDGYMFDEDNGIIITNTICLLSSKYLTAPVAQHVKY